MTLVQKFDGRHLRLDGQVYQVLGRHPTDPVYIVENSDGHSLQIHVSAFRDHIRKGNVSEGRVADFTSFKPDVDQDAEMKFRRELLRKLAEFQNQGLTWPQIVPALQNHFMGRPEFLSGGRKIPSKRTIQAWRKRHFDQGAQGLFDHRSRSGNTAPRFDVMFEEIVLDLIERSYLKSDRYDPYNQVQLEVFVNQTDIRQVAVKLGLGSELIVVNAKDPNLPAISVGELQRIKSLIKREEPQKVTTSELIKAVLNGKHHAPNTGRTRQTIADQKARQARRDRDLLGNTRKPRSEEVARATGNEPQLPISTEESSFSMKPKFERDKNQW